MIPSGNSPYRSPYSAPPSDPSLGPPTEDDWALLTDAWEKHRSACFEVTIRNETELSWRLLSSCDYVMFMEGSSWAPTAPPVQRRWACITPEGAAEVSLRIAKASVVASIVANEELRVTNAALVAQNVALQREAAQLRTRWQDAAERSDAERQRRQNAARGIVMGRADGLQILIAFQGKEIAQWSVDNRGRKVALVLLDDDGAAAR